MSATPSMLGISITDAGFMRRPAYGNLSLRYCIFASFVCAQVCGTVYTIGLRVMIDTPLSFVVHVRFVTSSHWGTRRTVAQGDGFYVWRFAIPGHKMQVVLHEADLARVLEGLTRPVNAENAAHAEEADAHTLRTIKPKQLAKLFAKHCTLLAHVR
jgi:hypothetical protein